MAVTAGLAERAAGAATAATAAMAETLLSD